MKSSQSPNRLRRNGPRRGRRFKWGKARRTPRTGRHSIASMTAKFSRVRLKAFLQGGVSWYRPQGAYTCYRACMHGSTELKKKYIHFGAPVKPKVPPMVTSAYSSSRILLRFASGQSCSASIVIVAGCIYVRTVPTARRIAPRSMGEERLRKVLRGDDALTNTLR